MAMKLRNKTGLNIVLDDLNGITVPASADYDFDSGVEGELPYSLDLFNAITADQLVLINSDGVELAKTGSLEIVNSGYDITIADKSLGNPVVDGQILSSTTAGVRSWVNNNAGGGETNIDGGHANSVYTYEQVIDGGGA